MAVTYSYSYENLTNIDNAYSTEDYGLISSASTSSQDFGQTTDIPDNPPNTNEFDWYFISVNQSLIPFGSFSSLSSGQESVTYSYVPSGLLFNFAAQSVDDNVTFTWVGNGTLFEIGNGLERTLRPYVSSGTLRLGEGSESANSVTLSLGDTLITSVSGIALESETDVYVGIGTIFVSQELVHPNIDYTPAYSGTGLINISGSAVIENNYAYASSGTLFGFGEKLESRTFIYDESSIVVSTISDYGFISAIPTQFSEDYGDLNPADGNSDYGVISGISSGIPETLNPFGSIFVSGASPNKEIQIYGKDYITSGKLTISGKPLIHPDVDYTPALTGSGLITFSGNVIESETDSYVGSGSATFSGTALESLSAQTPEDFVLYSFSGAALESFSAQTPEDTQLFVISGFILESETDSYVGSGSATFSGTLVEKDVDSYVGSGLITLSGSSTDSYTAQTPEDFVLYSFSGTALESFSAQTPEDFVLYSFSGTLVEKDVDSYVGSGSATFSGTLVEKDVDSYVGSGSATLSGAALESFSAQTPEDFVLYSFSGAALESFSAQTPEDTQLFVISGTSVPARHFILDGIGNVSISGTLVEKDVDSYVGVGTLTLPTLQGIYNKNLEYKVSETPPPITLSDSLVERVGYSTVGVGTIFTTISSRNYSNVYPGAGGNLPDNAGIGTIRINDDKGLTITKAELPVAGSGTISLTGQAFESYGYTNYNGSGISTISGIASTRKFGTYTYTGICSAIISQQTTPIIIKSTSAYFGSGFFNLSGQFETRKTYEYLGNGSLFVIDSADESATFNPAESSVLYSISGSALESYVIQPDEDVVLYEIIGNSVEKTTSSYNGSGEINLSTESATTFFVPSYPGNVLFNFITKTSDDEIITCDSEEVTCDYESDANVKFIANPPENTILFEFDGNALTRETNNYEYETLASYTLSGSYQDLRIVYSESGIGTIFTFTSSLEKESESYIGLGSLFALSGSSESYSAQTPDSSVLLTIGGSATTEVEFEYAVVGIGLFNFNGLANTKEIKVFSQIASGNLTLSGELIYPNIKFIPAVISSGSINIIGSSNNSLTKTYEDTFGTLFGFSSGFESFTPSTYVGIGSITIQEISGISINNPYQIPRTYVVII
jgi:hypothetical protein